MGGTSRMNREIHVRICERLGVQFPGPTRRRRGDPLPYADCDLIPSLGKSSFLNATAQSYEGLSGATEAVP